MTETTAFPPPEDPEGTEQPTADIVPFPLKKKTDPADPGMPAGVVKPGEWEAELPDTDDPETEGLSEGGAGGPAARGLPALGRGMDGGQGQGPYAGAA